jgi:transcriptional regulator with XRE-family HTH domain
MEKSKLIEVRTKKGFTQQQIAKHLVMDVSNFNRREKGQIKISNQEWEKLSKLLEVPLEDIYESDDSMVFICRDNATGNYQGNNHIYSIPEYFLENQRKYIQKL